VRHVILLSLLVLAACGLAVSRAVAPPVPSAAGAMGHGPTIVLVHGLGSSAARWLPVARLLARHHRVVLMDLPGHGDTPMPDPFTLGRAVESLDLALRHDAPDPCILVGHSVAGLVVAAEALEHPERVRGLVLVDAAMKPQITGKERADVLAALDRNYDGLLRDVYGSFGRDSAQGAALYAEVAGVSPGTIKPWVRLALTADLSAHMPRLEVPVLVLVSTRTWPHGEAWSTAAADLGLSGVPHLDPVCIEGTGHFLMLDKPAEVAHRIEGFADWTRRRSRQIASAASSF